MPKTKFNPPKYQCAVCGNIIQSKHQGHFCQCSCKEDPIAVDFTSSYGRLIGPQSKFIKLEVDNDQ